MISTLLLSITAAMTPSCKKEPSLYDSIINKTGACTVKSIAKIYDAEKHCAFTDLTKWADNYFLVFRVSDNHAYTKDGVIKVLKSADGVTWKPEISYGAPDLDLRDPKFCVNNNHLEVYAQGVRFNPDKTVKTAKGVLFNADSGMFRQTEPSVIDYQGGPIWPWRFSAYHNEEYSLAYNQDAKVFKLVGTKDYKNFNTICDLGYVGRIPTEGTIRFNNGRCYVLVRRSGPSLLGVSTMDNLCNFKWTELPLIGLGGPNFVFYDDNTLLISGRDYASPDYSYASNRTSLFVYKISENKTYRILTLPTSGDTAYPGMYLNGNELWISYHSTHEGSTKVYLAKVELTLSNL
jgi:hypothetical protein